MNAQLEKTLSPLQEAPHKAGPGSRIRTERQMLEQALDFSGAYMGIQYIADQIETVPETITRQTCTALFVLVESDRFETQKQILFLYRKAFEALVSMVLNVPDQALCQEIIPRIQQIMIGSTGKRNRAASESLSHLPIRLNMPDIPDIPVQKTVAIPFDEVLSQFSRITGARPGRLNPKGRSIVCPMAGTNLVGVIKFANSMENVPQLAGESRWMTWFSEHTPCPETRFLLPEPVLIQQRRLLEIDQIPKDLLKNKSVLPMAIAYTVHEAYFDYPNDPKDLKDPEEIRQIFSQTAGILGRLGRMGIIHTALIPLFHNRVQQDRRQDQGVYLWEHAGRLDQWLESCEYPNFSTSGVRDFEHLTVLENSRQLAHTIGEYILSLILVAGSWFRNKAPSLRGLDSQGKPVDARHLFDPGLFAGLIRETARAFHHALTGRPPSLELPVDHLVRRLIEQMGIDEHMAERLRIEDQENMDDDAFSLFLKERGIEDTSPYTRGKEEILLLTGPHLGGFNQPISVPELIEFLFSFSALCISDRFITDTLSATWAKS